MRDIVQLHAYSEDVYMIQTLNESLNMKSLLNIMPIFYGQGY